MFRQCILFTLFCVLSWKGIDSSFVTGFVVSLSKTKLSYRHMITCPDGLQGGKIPYHIPWYCGHRGRPSSSLRLQSAGGFENGSFSTSSFQKMLIGLPSSSSSLPLSEAGIGDVPAILIIPGVFLLGAISAFVFANIFYTPGILEFAEQIQSETREEQMTSILDAVQQHVSEGKDLEELRRPLEVALNMSIENYVQAVNAAKNSSNKDEHTIGSTEFTEADQGLASLLDSKMIPTSNFD